MELQEQVGVVRVAEQGGELAEEIARERRLAAGVRDEPSTPHRGEDIRGPARLRGQLTGTRVDVLDLRRVPASCRHERGTERDEERQLLLRTLSSRRALSDELTALP